MRNRNNKMEKLLVSAYVFLLFSCTLNAKENAPYLIHGEMTIEASSDYEIAGLDLYLFNKSEKQISSFTLVFFLFDEDGNAPEEARNSIVINVQTEVDPLDSISTCLSLDKYMYEIPEKEFFVDYIYLSKITYSDGSVWKDPFGQMMF